MGFNQRYVVNGGRRTRYRVSRNGRKAQREEFVSGCVTEVLPRLCRPQDLSFLTRCMGSNRTRREWVPGRAKQVRHTIRRVFNLCPVDHGHEDGMALEDVVSKRNDHDDCCGRGVQRQPGKSFDEGGKKVGGKMSFACCRSEKYFQDGIGNDIRRAEEELCHAEEPGTMLQVKDIAVKESIEASIE
jgi:hypothetical protein